MRIDDLGHAYELAQRLESAQKVIAHLEAMNNADTVTLTIHSPDHTVTVGPAGITVGPLLKCFRHQTEDLRSALVNYGVELEAIK